jgi:hypothetical protein
MIVVEEESFETASHLVSHLLREIESSLRHVLEPLADQVSHSALERKPQGGHEASIRVVLRALDIPENDPVAQAWLRLPGRDNPYGLHLRAHRRALAPPRPFDREFQEFFDEFETVLDIVLEKFEARYLAAHRIIDSILSKETPTGDDMKKLRNNVPNNLVALGYFFDSLEDESWLVPLQEQGFFDAPPDPELDHEEGTVRFPPWPQSRYLARMASEAPSTVHNIALGIPLTQNVHVHEDLVEVALALPPTLAADFAPKARQWLGFPHKLFLPERLGALVIHLIKGGEVDAGVELAETLFSVRQDERTASSESDAYALSLDLGTHFFDTEDYRVALDGIASILITVEARRVLTLLCDLLDEATSLSNPHSAPNSPYDGSHLWRPMIEEDRDVVLRPVVNELVSTVCDAAERVIVDRQIPVADVVSLFEGYRWYIFQRLALHILRLHPEEESDLVREQLLINMELLNELGTRREYALLLHAGFQLLEPADQRAILEWIMAGPDLEAFVTAYEERHGRRPSPAELAEYRGEWCRDRLGLVIDDAPEVAKRQYEELVEEFGSPRPFTAPMIGPTIAEWVRRESPKNADELGVLSIDELVDFLKNWQPSGEFRGPSREGLGRELSALVAANPGKFIVEIEKLYSLSADYMHAFLLGLSKALKDKNGFDWSRVLPLFLWLVKQPRESDEHQGQMEAPSAVRRTVAEILSTGMNTEAALEIPFDLRNDVWEILQPLVWDPEPTPVYETSSTQMMDPATLSINTVSGKAMHAVMRYAQWVRRHSDEVEEEDEEGTGWLRVMPEVQQVLDEHLEPTNDSSPAIRAVYGQWFPMLAWLDTEWARKKASAVFPLNQSLRRYRDAAWNAYLCFNPAYHSLFELLKVEYTYAVEELESDTESKPLLAPWLPHNGDERLAVHLVSLYRSGILDLNDPEGLLVRFFEKASDKLRGFVVSFIGRSLHKAEVETPPLVLARLKVLIEWRLDAARSGQVDAYAVELAPFGWWFTSEKFEERWSLTLLRDVLALVGVVERAHRVVERLAVLATTYPALVVECLSFIVGGEVRNLHIHSWREQIRTILHDVLERGDQEARSLAIVLIHRLGARGFLDFGDLLPEE